MFKGHEDLVIILAFFALVALAAAAITVTNNPAESNNIEATVESTSAGNTEENVVSSFPPSPPISGAIFTTTPDGEIVDENVHYDAKREVYLDGGPPPNAPVSAAGLDEGLYVFQVTNPNGAVALSEDPAKCRIINVSSDGVIVNLALPSLLGLNLTDNFTTNNGNGKGKGPKNSPTVIPCHIADPPNPPDFTDEAGESERHDINADIDHWNDSSAIVVQLMPFWNTPNPGGVYKAWVIPLQSYLDKDGDLDELPADRGYIMEKGNNGKTIGFEEDPGFGPPRGDVKTDNFKVKKPGIAPPILSVRKFHDWNANGVWDSGEPEIGFDECIDMNGTLTDCVDGGGWPVNITDPCPCNTTNLYYTPFWISAEPPGDYIVEEASFVNWTQTVAIVDGIPQGAINPVTVSVAGTKNEEHEVIFGNFMPAHINGTKFIDLNGNGVKDFEEGCPPISDVNNPGCEGVTIHLDGVDGLGDPVHLTTVTDANGSYSFTNVIPGTYNITIEEPNGFVCSFPSIDPSSCRYNNIAVDSGDRVSGMDFGDLSYVEIHGIKFDDLNANGQREIDEPGLSGVTINLTGLDGLNRTVDLNTTTNLTGGFSFVDLWPGYYFVWEQVPEGRFNSTPTWVGPLYLTSDNVTDLGNVFGNYEPAEVNGTKFIDLNGNGEKDAGEGCPAAPDPNNAGCENVTIILQGTGGFGNPVNLTTLTDANGYYSFSNITPGNYTISVDEPGGFICSYPSPDCDYDEILQSGDMLSDKDFGDYLPVDICAHKFFDFNETGTQEPYEENLSGIQICLNRNSTPVTEDVHGDPIPGTDENGCQFTDEEGLACWMNLTPGNFTIYENLSGSLIIGLYNTTPASVNLSLESGQNATVEFGNRGPCNGLTPGYWANWRNHYNESQFLILLNGTIAEDIETADEYLDSYGCDHEDALKCMRRFVLANQLTLSLTQNPELPNPSNGSMFGACLLSDPNVVDPPYYGSLGDAIGIALEIIDDPGSYTRAYILYIKDILDYFAKQSE